MEVMLNSRIPGLLITRIRLTEIKKETGACLLHLFQDLPRFIQIIQPPIVEILIKVSSQIRIIIFREILTTPYRQSHRRILIQVGQSEHAGSGFKNGMGLMYNSKIMMQWRQALYLQMKMLKHRQSLKDIFFLMKQMA